MRVAFDTDRVTARRGQAVTLQGFIHNSLDRAVEVSYALHSDPQLHWSVLGPSRVDAHTSTPLTVDVQVPRDLPGTDTSVPIELVVQVDRRDLEARAGAIIDIPAEPRACAAFTTAPTVRLNPDGTATLTASIVNCGPFDLSVDLRVRHAEGWTFDVDTSNVTLSAGAGPVDVTAVVGRPGEVTIKVGDTVQVDVTADGRVLTSATLSVRPSVDSWRRRARRLVSSSVVAVVAVLALAMLGPRLLADEHAADQEQDAPGLPVLSVATTGEGAGTVNGDGIDCGPTCRVEFALGTQVTLTARPADGSVFSGWSGCDDVRATSCTVTLNSDREVTAAFGIQPPPEVTLTVTKTGSGVGSVTGDGIDCGATCRVDFALGTQVTLIARPADGSVFSGWSGCDDVRATSCTVTLSSDREVTATFGIQPPPPPVLSVATTGEGAGTVNGDGIDCGATCRVEFALGTQVTLIARPADGSVFSGWSGCDDVRATSCTVTLNSDREVTATFGIQPPPEVTLTVTKTGSGVGTVTGHGIDCGATCTQQVMQGTKIVLEAKGGQASRFVGWAGCDSPNSPSCTVTMDDDKMVSAKFDEIVVD